MLNSIGLNPMCSGLTTVTELHEVISLEIVPNHQQNSSISLPFSPLEQRKKLIIFKICFRFYL